MKDILNTTIFEEMEEMERRNNKSCFTYSSQNLIVRSCVFCSSSDLQLLDGHSWIRFPTKDHNEWLDHARKEQKTAYPTCELCG